MSVPSFGLGLNLAVKRGHRVHPRGVHIIDMSQAGAQAMCGQLLGVRYEKVQPPIAPDQLCIDCNYFYQLSVRLGIV